MPKVCRKYVGLMSDKHISKSTYNAYYQVIIECVMSDVG
jgi:hypothetical protein